MNRQEIKDIVYNKLKAIFIDEHEMEVLLSKYPILNIYLIKFEHCMIEIILLILILHLRYLRILA